MQKVHGLAKDFRMPTERIFTPLSSYWLAFGLTLLYTDVMKHVLTQQPRLPRPGTGMPEATTRLRFAVGGASSM